MIKNIVKFSGMGLVIAVIGAGALYGAQYLRMQNDPEYRQMKEAEKIMGEWERQYREDTYGGETPEETLRLFIEALQKGDTDLAAKYFPPDEYENWRKELEDLKKQDSFKMLFEDLAKSKLTKETSRDAFFTLVGPDNLVEAELVMHKNLQTGVWKITEL